MQYFRTFIFLFFLIIICQNSFADDPFTRSLADPEPIVEQKLEVEQEEVVTPEQKESNVQVAEADTQNKEGDIENIEKLLRAPDEVQVTEAPTPTSVTTETQVVATPIKEKVPLPKSARDDYVSKIVNIDPISGHDITRYQLKGVAVSKTYNSTKKRRVKSTKSYLTPRKKIEFGNIPKTHIVLRDETIDTISKKYGFTKEEIENANAIIPGKNTIIPGNRLVIPNRYHMVKEGETINIISEYYKLNASEVAAFNDLEIDEEIKIDQKLLLPFYLHITEKKQSLKEVAAFYRRTLEEILKLNDLKENALIDVDQYVKIPIHVNNHGSYQNLDIKSVLDYSINPKNLAIIEIDSAQFMVREGDTLGDKKGKIVKIQSNQMTVIQDGREFLFKINTPLVGSAAVSSLPVAPEATATPGIPGQMPDAVATPQPGDAETAAAENPVVDATAQPTTDTNDAGSTDVEDLFR